MNDSKQPTTATVETRGWISVSSGRLAVSVVAPSDTGQQSEQTVRRAIFMLSSTGIRSGPHDLLVHFSRQLAALGLVSIRFDYSYYGDSWALNDRAFNMTVLRFEAENVLQFFCKQLEFDEIILLGLCTGGEIALSLSQTAPRVVACVLWSTAAIHSPLTIIKYMRHAWSMLRLYAKKLLYRATWRKMLTRQLNMSMIYRALIKRQLVPDAEKQIALTLETTKPKVQQRFPSLFVYGERDPDRREAERYYKRLFGEHASIAVVPRADHNFSSWIWEKQVCDLTIEWLNDNKLIEHPELEASDD